MYVFEATSGQGWIVTENTSLPSNTAALCQQQCLCYSVPRAY